MSETTDLKEGHQFTMTLDDERVEKAPKQTNEEQVLQQKRWILMKAVRGMGDGEIKRRVEGIESNLKGGGTDSTVLFYEENGQDKMIEASKEDLQYILRKREKHRQSSKRKDD